MSETESKEELGHRWYTETIEVTRAELNRIHENNIHFSEPFTDPLKRGVEGGSERFYEELMEQFDEEIDPAIFTGQR